MFGGALIDSKGNQCGLIGDTYSPCKMKIDGDVVNWRKCSVIGETDKYTLEHSPESLSSRRIYPEELYPKEGSSWSGVPLDEWVKRFKGPVPGSN